MRARQRRTQLAANRGRPEFIFDFYNAEWDEEEEENERTGLLGRWGADELDRLLAGGGSGEQPKRQGQMNYGTRAGRGRRRSTGAGKGEEDPTILPGSSMFGFLERLPWNIGRRGVRYKPSAADLQDVAGETRKDSSDPEASALLEDSEEEESYQGRSGGRWHKRNRSVTTNSQSTTNSLSSRGDLFPSEDEAADAVPLDDEFAITLSRRSGSNDDFSSGKSRKTKSSRSMSKPSKSAAKRKALSRSHTGQSTRRHGLVVTTPTSATESVTSSDKTASAEVTPAESDEFALVSPATEMQEQRGLPTMEELEREEEEVRQEEEAEIQRKREEARQVAQERGLELSPVDAERGSSQREPSVRSPLSPSSARESVDAPGTEDSRPRNA